MPAPSPMRPVEFLVLVALGKGPSHGYGIVKTIAALTNDGTRVEPGNLYRVVDRLMGRGLVAETTAPVDEASDDERRRYYRITERGREVLTAEARLLGALADTALDEAGASPADPA